MAEVPLTAAEHQDLHDFVLSKACAEFRAGLACIRRNDSKMIGRKHAACDEVDQALSLVAKI